MSVDRFLTFWLFMKKSIENVVHKFWMNMFSFSFLQEVIHKRIFCNFYGCGQKKSAGTEFQDDAQSDGIIWFQSSQREGASINQELSSGKSGTGTRGSGIGSSKWRLSGVTGRRKIPARSGIVGVFEKQVVYS